MADVAKQAGVSLSTVSHALSGKRPISEETKQRIFQVMAELDYQPHALARGLATRRSRIIALLLPFQFKNLLEAQCEFVTSAAEAASKLGYSLVLWTSPSQDLEIVRMTQQGFVDGLILMEIKMQDARVKLLKDRHYPFSMIGRCENNEGISFVDLDFECEVQDCIEYLHGLGHREVGLLAHSPALYDAGYGPAVRSISGFQSAVRDRNMNGVYRICEPTQEDGYFATQALLADNPSMTALINITGASTSGMMRGILDSGRSVPDDFSVIAFATIHQSVFESPTLTTIDFPSAEMGRIGTEMLIRRLEDETLPAEHLLLRPGLTIRQSTAHRVKIS